MYKVIMVNFFSKINKEDVFEKIFDTREEAEGVYKELFGNVRTLIIKVFEGLIEANEAQTPVLQQVIDIVSNMKVNEELTLNSNDGRFLLVEKGHIDFNMSGMHVTLKIEEI